MQTEDNTKKVKNQNFDRTTDINDLKTGNIKKDTFITGSVSDVKIHKDFVLIELYIDEKESYGYFELNFNKGREIKKLENSIGSKLHNMSDIIGTKLLIYQDEVKDDHYVLYSNKDLDHIKISRFFELDKHNYNNSVRVKDSGHLIYVLLFLSLMIPLLLTGIHILFIVTLSGLFSLVTPSIMADVINSYYSISSKKLEY